MKHAQVKWLKRNTQETNQIAQMNTRNTQEQTNNQMNIAKQYKVNQKYKLDQLKLIKEKK